MEYPSNYYHQDGYVAVLMIEKINATKACLEIVPSHWIIAKTLYFPPPNYGIDAIQGLMRSGKYGVAVHERIWRKYPFIIKKRLRTYDEAIAYKNQNQDAESDSDDKNIKILKQMWRQMKNIKSSSDAAGNLFIT